MAEWIQVGLLAMLVAMLFWRNGGKRQMERWVFKIRRLWE